MHPRSAVLASMTIGHKIAGPHFSAIAAKDIGFFRKVAYSVITDFLGVPMKIEGKRKMPSADRGYFVQRSEV
jgi:hypothetical protein